MTLRRSDFSTGTTSDSYNARNRSTSARRAGISDVLQIVSNPAGTSEVPLQFAMRGGMRKIHQRGIHLAEKLAETAQQLRSVRIYFGEDSSGNVGEQPEQALRSVGERRRP